LLASEGKKKMSGLMDERRKVNQNLVKMRKSTRLLTKRGARVGRSGLGSRKEKRLTVSQAGPKKGGGATQCILASSEGKKTKGGAFDVSHSIDKKEEEALMIARRMEKKLQRKRKEYRVATQGAEKGRRRSPLGTHTGEATTLS